MSDEFSFIDLTKSPEEIAQAHRERMDRIRELQEATSTAVGAATSDDERIKVTFSEADGVSELALDPRALRLSSEELANEIMRLVNEARHDAQQQLQLLVEESTRDGLVDPESVLKKMPDIEQSVDDLMRDTQAMTHQLMDFVERMRLAGESTPPRRPESNR